MQKRWTLPVAFAILLYCAPSNAQDRGRLGLTVAYPASVGLLWPVSKTVALRPEVSGSLRSSETKQTSESGEVSPYGSGDSRALAVGLSGLFYVREWEALRPYLAPRFAYSRSITTSVASNLTRESESVTSDYLVAGSFGLQYSLGRRFTIFAEVGVGYDRVNSSTRAYLPGTGVTVGSVTDATSWTIGPKSGIGAIFHF